ncbi:hypothetical protein EYF80_064284 [Liparis tanakae]|uniref:Uncharacterized protein n=1 Tax=Liparis tanakae TaxID=230148 RepID=A0A4Z2E9Y7_9TELE|nr:hypothetical protein EYF80_064284 [Liparis tanakae]
MFGSIGAKVKVKVMKRSDTQAASELLGGVCGSVGRAAPAEVNFHLILTAERSCQPHFSGAARPGEDIQSDAARPTDSA